MLIVLFRLDATKFSITKSQKKVLHKFNRYVKGGCKDETPSKKPANYVQVKSLKDSIHEPEIQEANTHKLKVRPWAIFMVKEGE